MDDDDDDDPPSSPSLIQWSCTTYLSDNPYTLKTHISEHKLMGMY